ncbi:unnamed protein product [Rotaria sp. Silwood1]|nr:unnamed protein product [Rotaria sp. Silwood1]CAF3779845.1 unnamed protein product [Rotaria sp. Silwood1]CAF4658861.1 unnamed protein product [Rotaria sp. Silwood1]CAF4810094.1 unnamed protein product [Rotaria sp. Silwood1]
MNVDHRVIALIDMDCFYVQVEQRLQPEFLGKPCGVAQYYTWKGGGLIAVNYEARNFGVKRGMRGEQAKELCPDFHVFHVQEVNGKANLTRYRDASADVFRVFNANFKLVEKASIDEAYIDLTEEVQKLKDKKLQLTISDFSTTHLAGFTTKTEDERIELLNRWLNDCQLDDEKRNYDLLLGAYLVEQIRKKVKDETGFFCSAGIARNKILAKLCCGFNKPKKQTIFTQSDIDHVFDKTPVQKIQGLGAKAGERVIELFQVEYIGQLRKYSLDVLQTTMGEKDGYWLFNLVRGIETTPVNSRNLYKSISASKNFPGKTSLDTIDKIRTWCHNLAEEVFNRLEKDRAENKRRAKLLTVTCTLTTNETIARSCPINEYSIDRFANDTLKILKQYNKNSSTSNIYTPSIISLGISAGKFHDSVNTKSIADLFSKQTTKTETIRSTENTINWQQEEDDNNEEEDNSTEEKVLEKPATTTILPIQGDFFRKFQKPDEQIKTELKSKNTTTTSSITSFFSRYTTNENIPNSSPNKSDDRYITCSKCYKSILIWNMPEHEDFHYAHELQMEENKTNSIIPTIIKTSKTIKRKNDKQQINNQTLDSFLNKKPKT